MRVLFRLILCVGVAFILTGHASAFSGTFGANAPSSPTAGTSRPAMIAGTCPASYREHKAWPDVAIAPCHSDISIIGKTVVRRIGKVRSWFTVHPDVCVADTILDVTDKPPNPSMPIVAIAPDTIERKK